MSWTKEDSARLRELHTACMTVSEIAEKMKKDRTVIRQELVRMGYLPREVRPEPEKSEFTGKTISIEPRTRKAYNRITPEIAEKIAELSGQGMSVRQISQKLGLSSSSVHYTLHKARKKPKGDKPVKAAQINEEFDAAVNQMIEEAQAKEDAQEMTIKGVFEDIDKRFSGAEKEPASAATDTSPEQDITPVIPDTNNTTDKPESQALNGIEMLSLLRTMLTEAFGTEAEPTYIEADRIRGEYCFTYQGREYGFCFGLKQEVPSYGNDKH